MPAVLLQPTSTAVAVVDWESVQSEVWSNGCWGAWGGGGVGRSVALGVMDRRMIYLRLIRGWFLQLPFFSGTPNDLAKDLTFNIVCRHFLTFQERARMPCSFMSYLHNI